MFGGNNPPSGTTGFGATTKPGGFSFGTPTASTSGGGFNLGGTPQSGASSGTPGFNFGGTPSATGTSGFSFGQSSGTPAASTGAGFSLGGAPQSTASAGFSVGGAPQASSTGGFSLGGTTQTQASSTPGFSLGGTTQSAAPGGFSLSGTPTQGSTAGFSLAGTSKPGLSLGGTTQGSTAGFSLGGTSQPSAANTGTAQPAGFNLQTSAAQPASSGFSLSKPVGQTTAQPASTGLNLTNPSGQTTTQPAAANAGFSLSSQPTLNLGGLAKTTQSGTQPPTTQAGGIFGSGLKIGATSSTAPVQPTSNLAVGSGFGLSGTTSAAPALGGIEKPKTATVGFSLPSSTTTASATAATVPQKQMNYQQLEENINKWMQDLEKQEKEFLEQATHVNAWDRLLVENGEKITSLNGDMERVKVEQQKLDHELDFIKSQQRELEELLIPLEKSVEEHPNISFQQHADLERENTYQLSENIDAQLKRMLQDLKEIIEHLNTSNANQDNTDPIFQITQILNSHMDSLQWIDQNSALLKRHVEDISKQMETQRKEQEKNFRMVYK